MPSFAVVLLFTPAFCWSAILEPEKILSCENVLVAHRAEVSRLFQAGLDDESSAGLVGLSQLHLMELLSQGKSFGTVGFEPRFENQTVRTLFKNREYSYTEDDEKEQFGVARLQAIRANWKSLLLLRLKTHISNYDPGRIDKSALDDLFSYLPITRRRLSSRAEGIKSRLTHFSISQHGLYSYIESMLDKAYDFTRGLRDRPHSYHRRDGLNEFDVEAYASLFGISLEHQRKNEQYAQFEKLLPQLFRHLPVLAGIVVAVDETVLNRIKFEGWNTFINELELKEIKGIEPVSDFEFKFLANLGQQ